MSQTTTYYEDIDNSQELKSCLNQYLSVIVDLSNEGFSNPLDLAKAEVFYARYSCFNHSIAINSHLIQKLYNQISAFSKKEQRSLDICARDIWKNYKEDIIDQFGMAMHHNRFDNIIDMYITFKRRIDSISPEVAEEIDNLMNMSDDEFNQYLKDKDEEEDEDDSPSEPEEKFSDYDIPDESMYEPDDDDDGME